MNGGPQEGDGEREAHLGRRMRQFAAGVLVVGLALSLVIYLVSPPEAPTDPAIASMQESRQYQLAMERIGGKATLLAARFNDWLASLWHGRRLAGTVALLSVALSGVLYLLGRPGR